VPESLETLRIHCLVPWLLLALLSSAPTIVLQAQDFSTTHVFPWSVFDREGRFVGGIKPEQIRVKGVPGTVRHLTLETAPRRTILLLDSSGSMGPPNSRSWQDARQFAIEFVSRRQGTEQIAVHSFADGHQVLAGFTTDSQYLIRQIETFAGSGKGRTMLGSALAEILSTIDNGLEFGDAIVLASDGKQSTADKVGLDKLTPEFTRRGLRALLMRVKPWMGFGTVDTADVGSFVKEIGGIQMGELRSPAKAAQDSWNFLRTFYRVELETFKHLQKPNEFSLELLDLHGKKMKKVKGYHPGHILPPPAQP